MNDTNQFKGGCHCGSLIVTFATARAAADLIPRVCQCSFCSKHGASYLFDAGGRLDIEALHADALVEYRQGLEIARFLVCRHCGVLVEALFNDDAGCYGALNARCLDGSPEFAPQQLIPLRTPSAEQRRSMWAKVWTPGVRVRVAGG